MAEKKQKFDFKTMHLSDIPRFIKALFKGEVGKDEEMLTTQTGFYEINLVPDVKTEMIRMQKVRNLVFFICIVVSVVSISVATILGTVKGAQDITMASQDSHLDNLSKKIASYEELPEFLTIQNQLKGISQIEDNQKVLSRAITLLNAILPEGPDTIEVSELSINLANSTMSFDAQADAKIDNIDYRVLESFIKRTNMMTFDYGRYVDSMGNQIPSRCIEEYDGSGRMYQENGSIYAIWKRKEKGCDPTRDDYSPNADGSVNASTYDLDLDSTDMSEGTSDASTIGDTTKKDNKKTINVFLNEKIYRTPQFTNWYKGKEVSTKTDGIDDDVKVEAPDEDTKVNTTYYKYRPQMDTAGTISGVPHFESSCITYTGEDDVDSEGNVKTDSKGETVIRWSADNICKLVPDGIKVSDSSNGKNSDDALVLRFSASIQMNADVFAYRNKHVMAIGPNNQNVTDSYVQLEKIFAAPAVDCAAGDTSCGNTKNATGV